MFKVPLYNINISTHHEVCNSIEQIFSRFTSELDPSLMEDK